MPTKGLMQFSISDKSGQTIDAIEWKDSARRSGGKRFTCPSSDVERKRSRSVITLSALLKVVSGVTYLGIWGKVHCVLEGPIMNSRV